MSSSGGQPVVFAPLFSASPIESGTRLPGICPQNVKPYGNFSERAEFIPLLQANATTTIRAKHRIFYVRFISFWTYIVMEYFCRAPFSTGCRR
jgi:hypothetical protein